MQMNGWVFVQVCLIMSFFMSGFISSKALKLHKMERLNYKIIVFLNRNKKHDMQLPSFVLLLCTSDDSLLQPIGSDELRLWKPFLQRSQWGPSTLALHGQEPALSSHWPPFTVPSALQAQPGANRTQIVSNTALSFNTLRWDFFDCIYFF